MSAKSLKKLNYGSKIFRKVFHCSNDNFELFENINHIGTIHKVLVGRIKKN